MKTITLVSTGARSTGRKISRWIATPTANETPTVTTNAAQYGQPRCSSSHAMKVEKVAISPCAKLIWCVAW